MTLQYRAVEQCIAEASALETVDKKLVTLFRDRLGKDTRLVRDEGVTDHYCAFFTPVSRKEKKIFIGHHIKSDSWLSPGGHLDKGETPMQTIVRECEEELGYKITTEKVKLAGLVYFDKINRSECTAHYDFWFLVYFDSLTPFRVEKKEFRDAGWYTIEEALEKKSLPEFRKELLQLSGIISV